MTTKLILIDTDTHVVVPREPTEEMKEAAYRLEDTFLEGTWPTASEYWEALTKAAPQLTPPAAPDSVPKECDCSKLVEALEFAQKKLLESAHPYDEAAHCINETLAKHKASMGEKE